MRWKEKLLFLDFLATLSPIMFMIFIKSLTVHGGDVKCIINFNNNIPLLDCWILCYVKNRISQLFTVHIWCTIIVNLYIDDCFVKHPNPHINVNDVIDMILLFCFTTSLYTHTHTNNLSCRENSIEKFTITTSEQRHPQRRKHKLRS